MRWKLRFSTSTAEKVAEYNKLDGEKLVLHVDNFTNSIDLNYCISNTKRKFREFILYKKKLFESRNYFYCFI